MKNISINLSNYVAKVVEPPTMKMRETEDGQMVPVLGFDKTPQFVVSVFLKALPREGQRTAKGEEVRFTLATDPGEGFTEDTRVEFIDPTVSAYSMKTDDGRELSGLTFKALGLKPVSSPDLRSAA